VKPDLPNSADFAELDVARLTTAERIAEAICDLILRGKIHPGTPLREVNLTETLGVSRNTIREALRVMAQDGLVTHNAYRGVTVTELSEADVADIFRARRTLEFCGVDASGSITEKRLKELHDARDSRDRAVENGDWATAFDRDMRFHATIVSLIGSERLDKFFVSLLRVMRLAFYMRGGLGTEKRPDDIEQHRLIESFIRSGEREKCREVLKQHLDDSERLLIELIQEPRPLETGEDLIEVG
jgi:DNA-binding GntR family transcriptional regulator